MYNFSQFENFEIFPDYEITAGVSDRELSEMELINRDFFRGRFSNKRDDGSVIYNWEDN